MSALELVAARYKRCADVLREDIPITNESHIVLFYCRSLCDMQQLNRTLLPELQNILENVPSEAFDEEDTPRSFRLGAVDAEDPEATDNALFGGAVLIGLPGKDILYLFRAPSIPSRNTEETNIEVSIRGPRDGFVEAIQTNLGLLRRRLPTNTVAFDFYRIGTKTKTQVALIYDTEKINATTLRLIHERLGELETQIEELTTASQAEELLSDQPFSLFPLTIYTGRPDYVSSCVLRGRFALIIDGVPGASVAPANLNMLLQTPEDAHFNYISASFGRLLRIFSLLVAIFLPGSYIALTGYHQDQIPYPLLATIVQTRQGIPLSTPLEMLLVLGLLEMFKEAGYRLPSMAGQTLTVVGGIVIGDAAIRAGLSSPAMIVVSAISIVAGSTLVSQTLGGTVSILRLIAVLISSILGMYGFILSVLILVVYLTGLTSFGVSYLAPEAPFMPKDIVRSFLLFPRTVRGRVPKYLRKKR
ncbi:spore germination protein [Cohnella soli]|uniref:Spore germination protein n=1 Tax=Cohnella soli TaxID=425005 RepID=A0ABW0HRC4_9BACL